MSHRKRFPSNAVVEVAKPKRRFNPSKRTTTIAIVALIIVIAGAAGWAYYDRYIRKDLATGKNIDWSHVPAEAIEVSAASKSAEEGDLPGSIAAYDTLIAQQSNKDKKAGMYSAKGNVCATYKDYVCALASHEQAMALQPDDTQYIELAAGDAYMLNQKDKATTYYQQIIDKLQGNNDEQAKQKIQQLQEIIDGMQAQ